ncbi:MAG: hypothetical protein K0R98_932 [Rickettsiaceae bacterium]|jgi:hypothetical protein|nr:hypothetical protein [Rickettsiaceae bacterium]
MGQLIYILILASLSTAAFAKAIVQRQVVQEGIYKYEAKCTSNHDEIYDPCLCEANIYKPVVDGIPTAAAKKINSFFSDDVDPKKSANFCPGTLVKTHKKAKNTRVINFEVTFNDCLVLAIATSYYHYEGEMAHGDGHTRHSIFDTQTGNKYTYRKLFGDDLGLLNQAISKSVTKQLTDLKLDNIQDYSNTTWIELDMLDKPAIDIKISDKEIEVYFPHYTIAEIGRSEMYAPIPTHLLKNTDIRKCIEDRQKIIQQRTLPPAIHRKNTFRQISQR